MGAGFTECVGACGVVDFWAFAWTSTPLDRPALDRPALPWTAHVRSFLCSPATKCRSWGLLVPFGFPEKPTRTISVVLEPRTQETLQREKQMAKCVAEENDK